MNVEPNPFAGPQPAPSPLPHPMGIAAPIVPFASGHKRALWTMSLLLIAALTNAICTGSSYLFYRTVRATNRPAEPTVGPIDWINNLAMIGCIVAFCLWTHRVYRNLPALGARGLRYTPGWAVGWLFVPLANLVIPLLVFSEIWNNSMPIRPDATRGKRRRISLLLVGWWAANLLMFVVFVVAVAMLLVLLCQAIAGGAAPNQVARLISGSTADFYLLSAVIAPAIGSVAAILAVFVVWRIDVNQRVKYEQISAAAAR